MSSRDEIPVPPDASSLERRPRKSDGDAATDETRRSSVARATSDSRKRSGVSA